MADLEYPEGLSDISGKAGATNDAVSFIRFNIFKRIDAKSYSQEPGVSLYMPESLQNPTNVSWDGQSMGPGGMENSNLSGFFPSVWQAIGQGTSAMASKAYGGSEASGQDILANKEQKIVNPYMKMLFKGVNFRNFEFTFRFTPQSEDDCKTIDEIVKTFRRTALPEKDSGFKWKYPSEVEIAYKYQGKDHPWLNKFKRCVITDCNVNYTGAGHFVSMRNGFPAETELRLAFSEIEVMTREDIDKGF